MKERPILFSGAMVRAILAGTKTATRRIVKPQPEQRGTCGSTLSGVPAWYWASPRYDNGAGVHYFHTDEEAARRLMVKACPYGVPGDRLWVRESFAAWFGVAYAWRETPREERTADNCFQRWYRAGHPYPDDDQRWVPSIHMPRWASRLTIELTGVRVERVQDISDDDARAEGVYPTRTGLFAPGQFIAEYCALWDSLNAKTAPWASNPWVWVVEFRRCLDTTGAKDA